MFSWGLHRSGGAYVKESQGKKYKNSVRSGKGMKNLGKSGNVFCIILVLRENQGKILNIYYSEFS